MPSSPRGRRRAAGGENITRCDYGHSHGWFVRIYRTEDGATRCHSKYFGDLAHGGTRRALKLAREWRDRMLPTLPPAQHGGARKPIGHGYVKRARLKRKVTWTECFVAWLRIEDGRAANTSYSIPEHGVLGARRLAQRWLARERRALRHRMNGARS